MKESFEETIQLAKVSMMNGEDETKQFDFSKLVIFGILCGLLIHFPIYAYQLTNPDCRWMAGGYNYHSTYWEVALGRWFLYFIDLSRGYLASPTITVFLSIILMVNCSILLCRVLGIYKKIDVIIVMVMMMAMPCFSFTLSYWYCADSYTLAMLLSIFSCYSVTRYRKKGVVVGAVSLSIMLGIYQAYLGVTVGLCVICLVYYAIDIDSSLADCIKLVIDYLLMGAIGISIYWGILNVFLKIYKTELSSYSGANSVGIANSLINFPRRALVAYNDFFSTLFGERIIKNTYWYRQYFWLLLVLMLMVITFGAFLKTKNMYKSILILLAILMFPIGCNIIEIAAPERDINILQSCYLCLMIPFLLGIKERMWDGGRRTYFVCSAAELLCIVIVWTFILQDNATYLAVQTTDRQTETVLHEIYSRVESLDKNNITNSKIMFAGYINQKTYSRDSKIYRMSYGLWSEMNSFWSTYEGSRGDWFYLFYEKLGMKLNMCTNEEFLSVVNSEEFSNMPTWPDNNSVKVINNIICVKMMEDPPKP